MKRTVSILLVLVMCLVSLASAAFADDGMLRQGDSGEEVLKLQERLAELGYDDT